MKELVLSVIVTWAFVNALKPIISWIKTRKIHKDDIFKNGGMPSGHTSLVASLSTALYLETGFSPLFATALVLTIVVIYDAIRIRTIIEKQSIVINALTKHDSDHPKLEENVGHTLREVFVSMLLSIIIPIIIYKVF